MKNKRGPVSRGLRGAALSGILVLCGMLCGGCARDGGTDVSRLLGSPDETYEKQQGNETFFADRAVCYEGEEDPPVTTVYLTVGKGNEREGTDHTWEEVNGYPVSWYEERGLTPYACEAVLQVGDERGPVPDQFGYGELAANATVRLRGEGASNQQQKSYRITIKEGKGKWEEQKVVVLNKYFSDPLRFKNRLACSLMQTIPGMVSVRTRFVHLYVKDKTQEEEGLFEDYGLYTQVEQMNKSYLKYHGLDRDGELYEAEDFNWRPHSALRLATDPEFVQEDFERYLEIQGSDDHRGLLAVIEAVNDRERPIAEIIDTYFDRENLYHWMAFQILTGNREAAKSGYYLYSPGAADTWYFISGNSSGLWSDFYEKLQDPAWDASWSQGIHSLAENVLFRRILKDETCREELTEAVGRLYTEYLTEERIRSLAEKYGETVKPYVYELPDKMFARVTEKVYDELTDGLAEEVGAHYREYQESLKRPWPFHILAPRQKGETLLLSWKKAYVLAQEEAGYTVELSRDYGFEECIVKKEEVQGRRLEVEKLPKGQYFLRVRAHTSDGQSQDAFETYWTEAGEKIYSTMCFYVRGDGSIVVSEFHEDE